MKPMDWVIKIEDNSKKEKSLYEWAYGAKEQEKSIKRMKYNPKDAQRLYEMQMAALMAEDMPTRDPLNAQHL